MPVADPCDHAAHLVIKRAPDGLKNRVIRSMRGADGMISNFKRLLNLVAPGGFEPPTQGL
jgi:hypothetical protein